MPRWQTLRRGRGLLLPQGNTTPGMQRHRMLVPLMPVLVLLLLLEMADAQEEPMLLLLLLHQVNSLASTLRWRYAAKPTPTHGAQHAKLNCNSVCAPCGGARWTCPAPRARWGGVLGCMLLLGVVFRPCSTSTTATPSPYGASKALWVPT